MDNVTLAAEASGGMIESPLFPTPASTGAPPRLRTDTVPSKFAKCGEPERRKCVTPHLPDFVNETVFSALLPSRDLV